MEEYLRCFIDCSTWKLSNISGNVKYFWGEPVNEDETKHEELYCHLENEVWVNCGCSMGDNIFWYFQQGLRAEKVYAYEGDAIVYNTLKTNLELLPLKYRKSVVAVNEYISQNSSFSIIEEKITLLNADIEGNELDMLKALEKKIVSDRPVIAICVYHKMSDLAEIPHYINSIVNDYSYILRKYEASRTSKFGHSELVLYAIPNERKNK